MPSATPRARRALFALLLAAAGPAAAQRGALDPSFGDGGLVTADLGRSETEGAHAMARLPDGRVVLAGEVLVGARPRFAIARLLPDGRPDSSFGDGGRVAVPFPEGGAHGRALALLPDSRVVVAGYVGTGDATDLAVVRLTSEGALDPAFGDGGRRTVDVAGRADYAYAVAVDSAGAILLAGTASQPAGGTRAVVTRLTADGTLDATFEGGHVLVPFGGVAEGRALVLQPDGRIVVGGSGTAADRDFAVARLNADGTPDSTFAAGGARTVHFGSANDAVNALALQPDGRIVAVGTVSASTLFTAEFGALRLTAGGGVDSTFGTDGRVAVSVGVALDDGNAVAVLPDGRIVLAGTAHGTPQQFPTDVAVVRLTAEGALDPTFDGDGRAQVDAAGGNDLGHAMALLPDGGLLVAGQAALGGGNANPDFAIVRLTADGGFDGLTALGGFGPGPDRAQGVVVQPDGRIVAVGSAYSGSATLAVVTRWMPDGTPDVTFGDGGVATVGPPGVEATAVAVDAQGRLVVAGHGEIRLVLARLRGDGTPDSTFGDGGWLEVALSGAFIYGHALAVQPDGKVLVAGSDGADFVLFRFSADGTTYDGAFGTFGRVALDFHGGPDTAVGLGVLPDGRIVVGGTVGTPMGTDFGAARLLPGGGLDPTYGSGGRARVNPGWFEDRAVGFALRPDGQAALVGLADASGMPTDNPVVVRLLANGTPDLAFSGDGVAGLDFGGTFDHAAAAALLPDGGVAVVGSTSAGTGDLVVARLTAGGVLDAGFGTAGLTLLDVAGATDAGAAVAVQPDGRIVAAGMLTTVEGGNDLAVVRLLDGPGVPAEPGAPAVALALAVAPNPAAAAAAARFTLPDAEGAVRLALYDALGREVAVLAEGPRAAGPHEATLEVARLPAGVYLLRLEAGGQAVTTRLTIAR